MNMFAFIVENYVTLLIGLAVLAIIAWNVAVMIKKKKSGKMLGCGCGSNTCSEVEKNKH